MDLSYQRFHHYTLWSQGRGFDSLLWHSNPFAMHWSIHLFIFHTPPSCSKWIPGGIYSLSAVITRAKNWGNNVQSTLKEHTSTYIISSNDMLYTWTEYYYHYYTTDPSQINHGTLTVTLPLILVMVWTQWNCLGQSWLVLRTITVKIDDEIMFF